MKWQTVGAITTTRDYAFTPVVAGTLFKLKHISAITNKSDLKIVIRQAFEDDDQLALFDYKLISCKAEQEIISFNLPQGLTNRRLAIKRVDNLADVWTIEIQNLVSEVNYMPSYPSSPISNSSVNRTADLNFNVGNIDPVTLSTYSPTKVGTIITNKSNFNLYVSMGVVASFDVYDKILGYNEVFETPYNWSGEIYGICDIPDNADQVGLVKVRDFYM